VDIVHPDLGWALSPCPSTNPPSVPVCPLGCMCGGGFRGGVMQNLKLKHYLLSKLKGHFKKILSKPTNSIMHIICCSDV